MTIGMYEVRNPATGVLERQFPTATDVETAAAAEAATTAFAEWRTIPVQTRADLLLRVAELYRARENELSNIIVREMGKPYSQAQGEVAFAARIFEYYAQEGPAMLADEPLTSSAGGTAWIQRAPLGAVLGIMPWNYPYYQAARFVAPNLLAGNTVLLKPAPQCPESALAMEAIFRDCEAPEGVYTNIFATPEHVAAVIAGDHVVGVSVTGSDRTGAAVAALAGRHLKKSVLELGGSDPFIVLSAADVRGIARKAAVSRMSNAGQACNSPKRLIVVDAIYDEFVSELTAAVEGLRVGDPTDPDVGVGPLSSEATVAELMAQIDDAVAKGATVRTGGRRVARVGCFVEPTVLADVTPDMRAYREELFGPVAVVYRVADDDEAVSLANSSVYGLGGVVFSEDGDLAVEIARRLDVGMVWINETPKGGPDLPFGGVKRSGIGRELGKFGIDEFVNKKLIHTPAS